MAADTRDITSVQQSPPPTTTSEHSSSRPYQGKVYEVFNGAPITPPENANVLPGGTANTAGGRTKDAGLIDAVRTMKLEEFGEIHKKPCVRDSLLTGIASGFGIGGLRAILGAPIPKACNWAAGTFCLASFGMYEFCQRRRALELQTMKRAAEIIDQKKLEKARKAEEARKVRRKAKEEADRLKEEEDRRKQSSWKFW